MKGFGSKPDDGFNAETIGKMLDKLPPDIQNNFQATAYDIMADQIIKAGLRIEVHCRVTDKGLALTKQAIKVIASTGFPGIDQFGEGNETLEGLGLSRSPFLHPLSELHGEYVNLWGVASMVINAALGWLEDEPGPTPQAMEVLTSTVFKVSPTIDIKLLLARSRYDDRSLLKLASLINEGLNSSVVHK